MVNFPGRNDHRRRVLKEEVLAATNSRLAHRATASVRDDHQGPRYSEAAAVENHPQVTDFVPRRLRSIVLLVFAGLISTSLLALLHHAAPSLLSERDADLFGPAAATLDLAASGSVASWLGAVVLMFAAAGCTLVYSIRRHRIDDYRGRYRIWAAAAAACLLASATSVGGLHHLLAYALGHMTGWTALPLGAAWWIGVLGPPLAWVAARTLRDVAECPLAAILLALAICCYTIALTSYLDLVSTLDVAWFGAILTGSATLGGHWLLLAAVLSYARFVILDAQGLIPIRPARSNTPSRVRTAAARPDVPADEPPVSPDEAPSTTTEWVDGRQPEREVFDAADDDQYGQPRKLSKAERKRLRKFKVQKRAA